MCKYPLLIQRISIWASLVSVWVSSRAPLPSSVVTSVGDTLDVPTGATLDGTPWRADMSSAVVDGAAGVDVPATEVEEPSDSNVAAAVLDEASCSDGSAEVDEELSGTDVVETSTSRGARDAPSVVVSVEAEEAAVALVVLPDGAGPFLGSMPAGSVVDDIASTGPEDGLDGCGATVDDAWVTASAADNVVETSFGF